MKLEEIDILAYHKGKIEYKPKKETVKLYKSLKTHANGEVPMEIIDVRRPNEPEEIKAYRYGIYAPKTEHPISKVQTSLSKIRRSPDWKVDYSKAEAPTFLGDDTLEDYLETDFPIYDNIDSWLFDECMQNALIDTNAVCAIVPLKYNIPATEMMKPIPIIFNSDEVIYFQEEEFIIGKTDRTIDIQRDNFKQTYDVYLISTRNEIVEYYLLDGEKITEIQRFTHNLDRLLGFKFRGLFHMNIDGFVIWKSPIQSMVTHLNEAAREYSDLQAEKVLHIYSEKWTINTNTCTKCNGLGRVKNPGFSTTNSTCKSCNGTGFEAISPFKSHSINVDLGKPNTSIPPIPPAGYIQKDTAITKILEESVNKHLYMALEAVNMQFLYNVPINESGISKQWDRDETDNFAYKVASILKYIRENVAYCTNELRYYFLIPSHEQREKMLPKISIPQKYDLVNNALLIEEYKAAKDAKLSPVILASMEVEIAMKRFSHDESVNTYTKLVYELDPLYCVTEDEKLLRLQNKGITETDYIISSNIHKYVRMALIEDENFATLPYMDKMEVMNKYAAQTMQANSVTADLLAPNNE